MESIKKIDFGKELSHSEKEAQAWKTIWSAGQGVTSINDVMKTSKLIERLKNEFKESLTKQLLIKLHPNLFEQIDLLKQQFLLRQLAKQD